MEVSPAFGPVSGPLRLLRAGMIGIVMVLTGVLGHVSAGGLLPEASALAALVLALGLLATLFTGRPLPIRYIVLLIVAGQTAVHMGLSVTAGHLGDPPLASTRMFDDSFAISAVGQQLLADLSSHIPMMVAHLMAAATVGMWLGIGERALWALIADAHARLIRPLIALRAASVGRRLVARASLPLLPSVPIVRPRIAALASSVVRRGPPALRTA